MAHQAKIQQQRELQVALDFLISFKKKRGNSYDAAGLVKKVCKNLGLPVPDTLEVLKDMTNDDFECVMQDLEKQPDTVHRKLALWLIIRIYMGLTHVDQMYRVNYALRP